MVIKSLNVDMFLGAAADFEMLLLFARVESARAAHIVATGVAWRVEWCRCVERPPARLSRAAIVSNFARVVISACASTGWLLVGQC